MEFNQFDSLKDSKISLKSHNSPPNSKNSKSQQRKQAKGKANKIPKHPSINPKQRKNQTRIPGVKKPNSVSRTNNLMGKEETKRHKGKTPSFGNTNNPLFLNNSEINGQEMKEEVEESGEDLYINRKSLNNNPSTDLTDKFIAPILSHREVRKIGLKKSVRTGQRQRNTFNKIPPPLHKSTTPLKFSTHIGASTPKPGHFGKILHLISSF